MNVPKKVARLMWRNEARRKEAERRRRGQRRLACWLDRKTSERLDDISGMYNLSIADTIKMLVSETMVDR